MRILHKNVADKVDGNMRSASYEPMRELVTPMGTYVVAEPNNEFIV